MGLATQARAAAFTLALAVVPILAPVAGLTPVRGVAHTLGRAAVPTLAPVAAPIPVLVAVHTLVLAVEPTPVLVVGLTLVPEGLVTLAPEAAILINGTAHLPTASEKEENAMPLLDDSEVQDFWSAIAAGGYTKNDFELTEIEDKPQTSGVYVLRGKAVVRRKSTSVTREYPAGHMTAWVADFDIDLRGGAYGPA